jgi:hypothetical protein
MTQPRRSATKVFLALVFVLTAASAASAQPNTAQSFEQLQVLVSAGDEVKVVDRDGNRMAGRIADLSGSRLVLNVNGTKRSFVETDVREVRRRGGDSLANGAWWGFGVGAGIGILGVASWCAAETCSGAALLIVPLCDGALGAGIGVGVDALIRGEKALYRAPGTLAMSVTPILGRRTGVGVSLAF